MTDTPKITNSKDVIGSNASDDVELLNEDTPPEDEKEEKPKGDDELSDDELKLLEDDEKVEDDEEKVKENDENEEEIDEDKGSISRPSIKDITKKIPEAAKVFKEFPQLRAAYYNEGKYREIFDTPELAQEGAEKAEALDSFNSFLMEGSSRELLEAIGKGDKDALKNLVENFLPTVQELDKGLFSDVVTPVIDTVIRNLYRAGEKDKDNNMMSAAKILAKFLHNTYDIPEGKSKRTDPDIENERKKLDDERRKDQVERYNTFNEDVHGRTKRLLNKAVSDGLDPREELTEFTKSAIVENVIDKLGDQLLNDRDFQRVMGKLWKASESQRFSSKSAESIITAYLSRAKRLIPEIRAKVKSEAMGKSKKPSENGNKTRRDISTGTRTRSESPGKIENDPKKIDWRKTSDKDILA